MLHVTRVLLALSSASGARLPAGLQLGAQHTPVRLGLPREHLTRRQARRLAVLIQTDALYKLLNIGFTKAGIRT